MPPRLLQLTMFVCSFPWTIRILGFIMLCTLGVANLTLKRRLPAKSVAGGLFNPKAFKVPAFTVYCFSILVGFLGMYTRN
jgi:MFS transporter, MCT family, solute carrier family 16 (monocarboxylic acid transporters), member 10